MSSLENASLDDDESLEEKGQNDILVLDIIILASSLPMLPQHPLLKPSDLTSPDLLFHLLS